MNKRFIGVLIFAAIVSLGFSTVFYRLLVHQSQTTSAARTTVRLALATKDLEVGVILRDADVKIEDWPGAVPALQPGLPPLHHHDLRQRADHRIAPGPQGRGRRPGRHDPPRHARGRGPRE